LFLPEDVLVPNFHLFPLQCRLLLAALSVLFLAPMASAADPAFVGILALAAEQDVADELKLTDEVQSQLKELIAAREDAALEVALRLKNLEPDKRAEELAAFVTASETQGLALLSVAQKKTLEQIRIRRKGMLSLAEPETAAMLNLSAEQKTQVTSLLEERTTAITKGGADQRAQTALEYERKLAGILTQLQKAAWEVQAGVAPQGLAQVDPPEANPVDAPPAEAAPDKPMAEPPADEPAVAEAPKADPPVAAGEAKLRFNFRYAPWKDVLDWFAEQADLSLVLDAPPAGTFNYTDNREYTPARAIDLLNSVLLTKGYTLLRRERMLMLINLEDGIPPALVERVPLEELDDRGQFELVSALFQLNKMTPEEAENEIKKLIGPQGTIIVLPSAKQVLVTETAGNLRTIRSVIDAVERPATPADQKVHVFPLKQVSAEELLVVARQLLGIPPEQNAAADGSIRIAVDPLGTRLFVSGEAETVTRFEEILKLTDVETGFNEGALALETPQLEVYHVANADPASVLQVMQTLLAGLPDVRLATDPKTGNLVALAKPSEHRTILATLDQMQRDQSQIEVMQLRKVDPQVALIAINNLFGGGAEGTPNGPRIDADPTSGQLFIRGTQSQVEQIQSLLKKMGEDDTEVADADRGNIRMIPLTGRAADSALQQMQALWPTMRTNRIRVVTPSKGAGGLRERSIPREDDEPDFQDIPNLFETYPPQPKPKAPAATDDKKETDTPPVEKQAARNRTPVSLAVFQQEPDNKEAPNGDEPPVGDKPEIVITQGPGGIVLASDDVEALNEFEDLLLSLADQASSATQDYTVFYLKYSKADVASALLQQIINGEAADDGDGGGGGGLMGDLASNMLGDMGGGLLGSLLGGGGAGGLTSSGAVTITPDNRLNALIVQANANDLDLIEQLLQVIDQKTSPEDVETAGKPRLIPVFYSNVNEVAGVVRQVYASRIDSGPSSQQRQPSPEEFMRALRGGRRGTQERAKEQEVKIGIGVDTRSNTLIVTAPDPVFDEIKALVDQLDEAGRSESETLRVVTLRKSNPEIVQRALTSILGSSVTTGTTTAATASAGPNQQNGGNQPSSNDIQDQIRRRIEFFNNLQRAGGGGDRGGRTGRGPGGPGGGGARPSGGGRSGGGRGGR